MKIIQLNVWHFKYLQEIIEFLKTEKPNVVNLQEVSSGRFNYCDSFIEQPFELLKKELKLNGVFAPFSGLKSNEGKVSLSGNAFLTDLEIVDSGVFFEPTLPNYTEYTEDHDLIKTTIQNDKSKYYNVFEEPKNFLWSVLKNKDGIYFRNIVSHFTVSYGCEETLQTIQQTRTLLNFLNNVKDIPVIFAGDLNIHDKSASVALLSQHLDLVNKDTSNSLNKVVHPIFSNIPDLQGLRVDYIFQKGFRCKTYHVPEITVSDHLPVVAELDLIN
ncbi:MAG: endonuclease/exonuclease/phosphatase family protein [Patescibacteria group bacterium]